MTTVTSINPQMFQWARKRAGIGEAVLRRKFPKLPAWENGVVFPTLRQLEDFSRATWAPLGYFRMMLPEDFEEERFCDHVAAEFLVPAAEFQAAWNEAQSHEDPFHYLARRFKVSQLVIARRARDKNEGNEP